jgi:hypothetical protein
MSLVDKQYNQAVNKLSGTDRVEKTISLFGSICEMLTLQLRRQSPNISERELRKAVAKKLYCSNSDTHSLIEKMDIV